MSAEFSALALGDRLKYLRWFIQHADQLQGFIGLLEQFKAATTLGDKLRVVSEAMKAAADIADDFPAPARIDMLAEADLEAQALLKNINWAKLRELAEWLIPIFLKFAV